MRRSARFLSTLRLRSRAAAAALAMSVPVTACDWPEPPEVTIPPPVTWTADARDVADYRVPVDGEVVDPFRAPGHPYGPGNRGIEYRTAVGTSVRAARAGMVGFAGPVAGRLVVAIRHGDGRRSTYTGLSEVTVGRGDAVSAGQRIGAAGPSLHFGVKDGPNYVDPALLFGPPEVLLIPDPATG